MLAAVVFGLALMAANTDCSLAQGAAGLCPAISNTGSSVDVGATLTRPGSGGDRDRTPTGPGASRPPAGGERDADRTTDDSGEAARPDDFLVGCGRLLPEECYYGIELVTETEEFRELTMADLVSFAPAPAPVIAEPGAAGIVGMPVNFIVSAPPHEQSGTLFDQAVTVRFAPGSFAFGYGDGTGRESPVGGATWAELGLPQFRATATSHAYGSRGVFTATATVRYTAAVSFGGQWHAVPGTLEIAGPATAVEIFEVRTALVARTCVEDPRGPGCDAAPVPR